MKIIIFIIYLQFLWFIWVFPAIAQTVDVQFEPLLNEQIAGGNYDVIVQIKSNMAAFAVGSSNLVFDYNTAAFESGAESNPPQLLTVHNYGNGNYTPISLTEPATGRLSLNIDLDDVGNGATLPAVFTDIATIRFTIKDPQASPGFSWRNESPNRVVVFSDDQQTEIPSGNFFGYMIASQNIFAGWNLVGLSLEAQDNQYLSLYPNASENTLFRYNGSYQPESELTPGNGYWLHFPAAETAEISGLGIGMLTLSLQSGWNLISGPACEIAVATIIDPDNIIEAGTFFGYNGSYFSATTLVDGQGYWVNTNAAGDVIFDCSAAASVAKATAKNNRPATATEVRISDVGNNRQSLFFDAGDISAALPEFDLPPVPPAGSFDARFSDGRWVSSAQSPVIQLQGGQRPLTVEIVQHRTLPGNYRITTFINTREISVFDIMPETAVQIHDPRINRLTIARQSGEMLPTVFAVAQNYPNPFNSNTEIRLALPAAASVDINIFNTIGQKITTLFSGEQPAGFHTVTWDGRDASGKAVASGVYLYRVQVTMADANTTIHQITKKMMLLR